MSTFLETYLLTINPDELQASNQSCGGEVSYSLTYRHTQQPHITITTRFGRSDLGLVNFAHCNTLLQ